MPAKKRRLSPTQKKTRSFIKERISFYSGGFSESKKQMFNALEEKRALERKIGTREPSPAEAERLDFLSYVAGQARKQANQYHKGKIKWKKKKNKLFPMVKKQG